VGVVELLEVRVHWLVNDQTHLPVLRYEKESLAEGSSVSRSSPQSLAGMIMIVESPKMIKYELAQ